MEECEHTIKIDKYLELRMKIPKELNVMEFTALLEKARKTLRLGEIEVESTPKQKRFKLSKDVDKETFVKEYENNGMAFMTEKYGASKPSIYNKISDCRKQLGNIVKKKLEPIKQKRFNRVEDETADKMVKMRKQGKSYNEIGEVYGKAKGNVWAIVKRRAKELGIKLEA